MSSLPTYDEANKWYEEVVAGKIKGRNKAFYHACCNTYSTRNCDPEFIQSHPDKIPFSDLFTYVTNRNEREKQVVDFYKKYCDEIFGLPDKANRNIRHIEQATDLSQSSSEDDSRYEHSVCCPDLKKMTTSDQLEYRLSGAEASVNKLTPVVYGLASKNKKLIDENFKLSGELQQLKRKQAEQELEIAQQKQQNIELNAKLEAILKALPIDFLGKREPLEEPNQTAVEEHTEQVRLGHLN